MADEGRIRALEARRWKISAGILLIGVMAALVIYVNAGPTSGRQEARLEDSKQYLRQLEFYGGTANVMANEARQLVASLWHGRRLAITVACLSTLLAGAAFVALTPLPSEVGGDYANGRQG